MHLLYIPEQSCAYTSADGISNSPELRIEALCVRAGQQSNYAPQSVSIFQISKLFYGTENANAFFMIP